MCADYPRVDDKSASTGSLRLARPDKACERPGCPDPACTGIRAPRKPIGWDRFLFSVFCAAELFGHPIASGSFALFQTMIPDFRLRSTNELRFDACKLKNPCGTLSPEHDPEKTCPGHSRPKDGVALLAYDSGREPVSRLREARFGGRRKVGNASAIYVSANSDKALERLLRQFHRARSACLDAGEMRAGFGQHALHEEAACNEFCVHALGRAVGASFQLLARHRYIWDQLLSVMTTSRYSLGTNSRLSLATLNFKPYPRGTSP